MDFPSSTSATEFGDIRRGFTADMFTNVFQAMGSHCEIQIAGLSRWNAADIARKGELEVRRLEAKFSRFRPESALSRINRHAAGGGCVEVDPETAELIAFAVSIFRLSNGAFDISSGLLRSAWDFSGSTLPSQSALDALLPRVGLAGLCLDGNLLHFDRPGMALDLGGLGKAYAADCAAAICRLEGARHGLVNLAGDIGVIGPRPDGGPWIIGIRHPRRADGRLTTVDLLSGGLATSGDYETYIEANGRRYGEILDPRTGWPARGLTSATVISDSCLLAGSLATSAMVKGAAGPAWLAGLGVRSLCLDDALVLSGTEVVRP